MESFGGLPTSISLSAAGVVVAGVDDDAALKNDIVSLEVVAVVHKESRC